MTISGMEDVGTIVDEARAEAEAKGIEHKTAYALGVLERHYMELQTRVVRLETANASLRRNGGINNSELDAMLIDMEQQSHSKMELLEAAATHIEEQK